MSKSIRNYKGKHRGYLQKMIEKISKKKTGIPPITMMWINFAAKSKVFMETRQNCRHLLKLKKPLSAKKRKKVLKQYYGIYKEVYDV